MRKSIIITLYLILTLAGAGCSHTPEQATETGSVPGIFPDYTNIVIPANIAPMNFNITDNADRYITIFSAGDKKIRIRGKSVRIPIRKWRKLLTEGNISVDIYTADDRQWKHYDTFTMNVSQAVDPYVSYRLIPPSFRQYEEIILAQRDLTCFREKAFYRNTLVQKPSQGLGQCVNCHSFQNYRTDNMQFHIRQYKGGTLLVTGGKPQMVTIQTENAISQAVYPAWHPTLPLIAYSTNNTQQAFHTADPDRIEVFDVESNLILYDISRDTVTIIQDLPDQMECFPTWAPDGRTLYFVSAQISDELKNGGEVTQLYKTIRYDLYSKPYNPETGKWGESRLIYNASADSCSVTLPRVSPDGNYLMLAHGDYGVFQIWHRNSDLWMMNLNDTTVRALDELNSDCAESYHSWSHDGQWVVFGTRRQDNAFTRLYLSHINSDGTFTKPFAIPQKNPENNTLRLFSYSIPEFTIEPVWISPHRFARTIRKQNAN